MANQTTAPYTANTVLFALQQTNEVCELAPLSYIQF